MGNATITLVAETENAKLGNIATTYAAIHTCPSTCPLRASKACYRNGGNPRWTATRLDNGQKVLKESHIDTARKEAALIRACKRVTDIRLHTIGDCKSSTAATIVSEASGEFMERTGRKVYTYTHAWRDVPRQAWGKVSVLASCETMEDVTKAWERGYAAAIIVPKHEGWKAYKSHGFNVLPCPAQTDKADSCKSCRVCMRDGLLRKANLVVAFEAHGPSKRVKDVLAKVN